MGKKAPKHQEHNAHGSRKKPFGAREDKAALLARMKEAAEDEEGLKSQRFSMNIELLAVDVVAKGTAFA